LILCDIHYALLGSFSLFDMLVILSIYFAWVGGGYVQCISSILVIIIFYLSCLTWSWLMGLRALSYIFLCIEIGSVYMDGTRFWDSGSI
jgi:hypothetical protein